MTTSMMKKNRGAAVIEMSCLLLIVVFIVSMAFYSNTVYNAKPENLGKILASYTMKKDVNPER
ncbi:hypothetical protein [Kistimonas asteriae]|uniref:hypothetical protein n=1 Tax=Kistimonas asteriae TaxID=517724 RepID=UPI001BACECC1|nr:hypothetical protein [Kistimonas asteriae]